MTSANPPYPYYYEIPFNSSFFNSDTETGSGLTVTEANALYLRKTVADTAISIETFNAGIKAQKVDGLLSSSIMYVGNNITSGSLILGNTGIRTKNQGILEAYSIRTPATTGQLTICTDLTTGGSVEIGSVNGTVNLLGSAAGGVNVPTSSGVTTNAVNVAYLTSQLTTAARLNQVQTFAQTNTFNGGISVVGTTNINTTGSSITTIGSANTTTVNSTTINLGTTTSNIAIGALTGAGVTTLNKPITIAYPVPTSTSQLGYYTAATMTWTTSATTKITSSPSLPIGVYLVSLALATFGTFVKNFVYFESAATGGCGPVNNNVIAFVDSTDRNVCNGNCILNITTAGIFDIKNFAANAQTLDSSATMRIVRLA